MNGSEKIITENLGVLNINVRQLENRIFNKGNGILDLAELFIQEKQKDSNYEKKHKEEVLKKVQEGGDIDQDLRVVYWADVDIIRKEIKRNNNKGFGKRQ